MTCRPKALVVVVVDGRLLMRTGRFGSNKLRKEPSKNVLVSVSTQEPIWSFLPCSFNAFHVLLCTASYPNSIGAMGRLWKKTNLLSACLAVCLSWMSVCWTELNHTTGKRRRARDVCVCVCVCLCVCVVVPSCCAPFRQQHYKEQTQRRRRRRRPHLHSVRSHLDN